MTQYPAASPPAPYAHSTPDPGKPKNWLGTAALTLAVVGLICSISVVGGVMLGAVAIIVGLSGRRRAKHSAATNGEIATAGIVLGAVAVVVSLGAIAIWVQVSEKVDFGSYMTCVSKNTDRQNVEKCATDFSKRVNDELGLQ